MKSHHVKKLPSVIWACLNKVMVYLADRRLVYKIIS